MNYKILSISIFYLSFLSASEINDRIPLYKDHNPRYIEKRIEERSKTMGYDYKVLAPAIKAASHLKIKSVFFDEGQFWVEKEGKEPKAVCNTHLDAKTFPEFYKDIATKEMILKGSSIEVSQFPNGQYSLKMNHRLKANGPGISITAYYATKISLWTFLGACAYQTAQDIEGIQHIIIASIVGLDIAQEKDMAKDLESFFDSMKQKQNQIELDEMNTRKISAPVNNDSDSLKTVPVTSEPKPFYPVEPEVDPNDTRTKILVSRNQPPMVKIGGTVYISKGTKEDGKETIVINKKDGKPLNDDQLGLDFAQTAPSKVCTTGVEYLQSQGIKLEKKYVPGEQFCVNRQFEHDSKGAYIWVDEHGKEAPTVKFGFDGTVTIIPAAPILTLEEVMDENKKPRLKIRPENVDQFNEHYNVQVGKDGGYKGILSTKKNKSHRSKSHKNNSQPINNSNHKPIIKSESVINDQPHSSLKEHNPNMVSRQSETTQKFFDKNEEGSQFISFDESARNDDYELPTTIQRHYKAERADVMKVISILNSEGKDYMEGMKYVREQRNKLLEGALEKTIGSYGSDLKELIDKNTDMEFFKSLQDKLGNYVDLDSMTTGFHKKKTMWQKIAFGVTTWGIVGDPVNTIEQAAVTASYIGLMIPEPSWCVIS